MVSQNRDVIKHVLISIAAALLAALVLYVVPKVAEGPYRLLALMAFAVLLRCVALAWHTPEQAVTDVLPVAALTVAGTEMLLSNGINFGQLWLAYGIAYYMAPAILNGVMLLGSGKLNNVVDMTHESFLCEDDHDDPHGPHDHGSHDRDPQAGPFGPSLV